MKEAVSDAIAHTWDCARKTDDRKLIRSIDETLKENFQQNSLNPLWSNENKDIFEQKDSNKKDFFTINEELLSKRRKLDYSENNIENAVFDISTSTSHLDDSVKGTRNGSDNNCNEEMYRFSMPKWSSLMTILFSILIICFHFICELHPLYKKFLSMEHKLLSYKGRQHWFNAQRRKLRIKFKKLIVKSKRSRQRKNKSKKRMSVLTECNRNMQDFVEGCIEGRRIVNFSYLWQEMRTNLVDHGLKCKSNDWRFSKESSTGGGLRTLFHFQCRRCNNVQNIWSEPLSKDVMDINMSSVLGTLAGGFGFYQVQELFATMHIPYITDKTFKRYQESLLNELNCISAASMKEAGKEEFRLAKDAGDVLDSGKPFITVVVDGSWLKRSFGSKYDSMSGLGAIIGKRTGKVLFVGIKNKYCCKCFRPQRKGLTPKDHKCYRNFSLDSPSTLMESKSLLEGFHESLDTHGLVYKYFIGDGDSSFHKNLSDDNPYAHLNIIPHKIECTNHLLRNLCRKITAVSKTTQKKGARLKGFVTLRNIVKDNILKIRQAVLDEIDKQRDDATKSLDAKVQDLQKFILNIPSHIFGEHGRCHLYGLNCLNKSNGSSCNVKNYVPYLKSYGIYQPIQQSTKYLSFFADSLIHKDTNNIVESFNNVICKFNAGKRINFALSNQYNTRVLLGVLQHNEQEGLLKLYTGMNKKVPHTLEHLVTIRKRKVERNRYLRVVNGRNRKFYGGSLDKNYGPSCEKPDFPEEKMKNLKKKHFEELIANQKDHENIELQTREQSQSDLWETIRKKMLTASNFGRICRMRSSTSCASNVKSILYPPLIDTVAMKYGRENEDIAREELEQIIRKKINRCGLFIDLNDPRFAASPDGTIDKDGIVEIKNPYRAIDLEAQEAMKKYADLNFVNKSTNGMKNTHLWYYQVQGQLHVTNRDYCLFALRTPKSIEIRVIRRDDEFWKMKMEPHLSRFYDNCLLPEILDSRYLRNMPIRDPDYILQAKDQQRQQKQAKNETLTKMSKEKSIKTKSAQDTEDVTDFIDEKHCNIELNLTTIMNDDLLFVNETNDPHSWTTKDVQSMQTYLNEKPKIIHINEIKNIILNQDEQLTDDALDAFVNVVQQNSDFEIQSVLYISYPNCVEEASTAKAAAILGGNCTQHWRLIYFDGMKLHVYDTIPNYTCGKLVKEELTYVLKRFRNLTENDIVFENIKTAQPDSISCGIYAAALLTHLVLKGDPSKVFLSRNVTIMRRHFFNIIKKEHSKKCTKQLLQRISNQIYSMILHFNGLWQWSDTSFSLSFLEVNGSIAEDDALF